ncbi:hypothetical protein ACJD0Z_01430 [Flavobacteriaceae bacterium M23B6Z8]
MRKILIIIALIAFNSQLVSCSHSDTKETDALYDNRLGDSGGDESHEGGSEDNPGG